MPVPVSNYYWHYATSLTNAHSKYLGNTRSGTWPTIKFNEALFEKMKENDGVVQVAIYVQDDDSLKVMFKPKWVNPNPKNKAGVQSPTPDAPAISDGALDDEIPF